MLLISFFLFYNFTILQFYNFLVPLKMSQSFVMSPYDESFKPKHEFSQKTAVMPEPREAAFKSRRSDAEVKTARVTMARVKNKLQRIANVGVRRQTKATNELLYKHSIADTVSGLIFNAKPRDRKSVV